MRGRQVPGAGEAEEVFLRLNAAGGVDGDTCGGVPALESGGDIGEDFAVEMALFVALCPYLSLNGFESGRFSVFVHEPEQIGDAGLKRLCRVL